MAEGVLGGLLSLDGEGGRRPGGRRRRLGGGGGGGGGYGRRPDHLTDRLPGRSVALVAAGRSGGGHTATVTAEGSVMTQR